MSIKLVSKVSLVALVFGLSASAAHAGKVDASNIKQTSASVKWETNRVYRSHLVTLTKSNSTKPFKTKRVSNSKKRKKFSVTFSGLEPGQSYKARVRGKLIFGKKYTKTIGRTTFTTKDGSTETASNPSTGGSSSTSPGSGSSSSTSGKRIQPHLITATTARIRWNPPKKMYKNYKVQWMKGSKLIGKSKMLPRKSRVYILRRLEQDTEYTVIVRAYKFKSAKTSAKKKKSVVIGTTKFKTKKM